MSKFEDMLLKPFSAADDWLFRHQTIAGILTAIVTLGSIGTMLFGMALITSTR